MFVSDFSFRANYTFGFPWASMFVRSIRRWVRRDNQAMKDESESDTETEATGSQMHINHREYDDIDEATRTTTTKLNSCGLACDYIHPSIWVPDFLYVI